MDVRGLGYIGIDAGDVDAWREYAKLLGTRVIAHENGFGMKIDDRPFRVVVRPTETREGLAFAGWELPDAAALEICAAQLESTGFTIDRRSAAECDQRRVRGLISTTDPGLALVPAGEATMYHFMLEMNSLDDVGYTLDRHEASGTPISAGLGKHTNDHMVSFYSASPSGFEVEIGCGGRRVDDDTWTVTQLTKPSFWGHRPPATP